MPLTIESGAQLTPDSPGAAATPLGQDADDPMVAWLSHKPAAVGQRPTVGDFFVYFEVSSQQLTENRAGSLPRVSFRRHLCDSHSPTRS